ncbi:MAG: 5'-methylthioadenosine/S-adenosylhomocysteine nucleosidase [Sphingomonas fennica]
MAKRAMWCGAAIGIGVLLATPLAAAPQGPLDTAPRTAIVSAFEPEWIALQKGVAEPKSWTVNGVRFVGGTMAGRPVLLFLSGVSMTNAAMTTQLALDRFNIRRIVFSGVAGGIDPSLDVGDVVVPDRWGQYLESVFAREENGRFVLPGRPRDAEPIANYGMIFPNGVSVRRDGTEEAERRFWFEADPALLTLARGVAAKITLDRCRETLCLTKQPKVVVGGAGISGPVFMDNAAFRRYAFDTYKATVTDMETAAVGQVAYANHVPYIAFRSLSDLAGGQAGENQARAFYRLASDNSAAVVEAFVAALPE